MNKDIPYMDPVKPEYPCLYTCMPCMKTIVFERPGMACPGCIKAGEAWAKEIDEKLRAELERFHAGYRRITALPGELK